jgi:predicted Fe-Mo cluster-binding NifX family protein
LHLKVNIQSINRKDWELIIAIASKGKNLDSTVHPDFNEAPFFLIVNTETWYDHHPVENPFAQRAKKHSDMTARFISDSGVHSILTEKCRNCDIETLKTKGIRVYRLKKHKLTIREAMNEFSGKRTM